MAIFYAIISAILYGTADFSGGFAARKIPVQSVLVASQAFGAVIAVAAALAGGSSAGVRDFGWGALAGLGGALGILFLYTGISKSIVAIVSPVSALVGALFPLLFGVITGEHASAAAWVGVAICLPATVLLSFERNPDASRSLRSAFLYGLTAGLGFGLFYIAISRPAQSAGYWPLVAARITTVGLITVASAVRRVPVQRSAFRSAPVVSAGILDMTANITFVAATHAGVLALVTVVTAMYPAPTVLLARVVLREKMGILRVSGVVLALAGVALIGLG